ncbi:GNAT family N-acetyltransferase [Chromobacterium amazonense]|uniref:GNAT family N-acetyltransferase n=1 Tax=Chromobacterium amazonense TaxID=1382803 RepID=UPI00237ECB3A|nr:GNAT family N-acetyltransferase [Chromobacterium amazonense]MDE1715954.1 GNAT family N-acetyltransferase [Chromobacterium amazonense]
MEIVMNILIRPALAQDWPALRRLFLASRRHTFPWLSVEDFRLADLDEQTAGEALWVAQDAGSELLGFVSLWEADYFIHHLHVAATQHRRGIGKMLLQALPRWEEQNHQLKCLRRNGNALAFYKACGFAIVGEGEGEEGSYLLLEHTPDARR